MSVALAQRQLLCAWAMRLVEIVGRVEAVS